MNADDIVSLLFDDLRLLETYFSPPWPSMIHEPYEMNSDCEVIASPAWSPDGG